MKINYIKNKFLLGFASCAILFGLGNSSALAQTRKPTAAEIQQAKTNLRQHVQSLKSSGMGHLIEDRRTPEQKQNRDRLVEAWKQEDPQIAPFLGSWTGYETVWSIYPSSTKGQVCIVSNAQGIVNLDFGTVVNNSIHSRKGILFVKEGNYLGVTIKSGNNQFAPIDDHPLNSPNSLKELYQFKGLYNDFHPAPKLLKPYAQAGCTASAPSNNTAEQTTIENLPDGKYMYGEIPYPEIISNSYLIFNKSGDIVTGVDYYPHSSGFSCFQGTARGNNIIDTTFVTPAMGRGNSIVDKKSIFGFKSTLSY